MEPENAIDPEGIREGRAAALNALLDTRGDSVIAYCFELSNAEAAGRAAAEALARFRSALVTLGAGSAVETEVLLLAATRHAAAQHADLDRLWQDTDGQQREQACELVPEMLAARALGQIGQDDLERLARHLRRCEGCRFVEAAFGRAEQAYRDPQVEPERHEAEMMALALQRAAPIVVSGIPLPTATADVAEPAETQPEAEGEPVETEGDILGAVEPSGFLDEADFDPRNSPTVVFDVLAPDAEGVIADAALVEHQHAPESFADDGPPRRSATLAFSVLALLAVLLVLGVTVLIEGVPWADEPASTGPAVTNPDLPRDPVPTTPATG